MFPQFKKINNESGIVLFIVLMVAIIIMIFSVSILTQSMNENNYAQQQIDQITSEQLTKGIFWNAYASGNLQNVGISTVMNGRNYQISLNLATSSYVNSYSTNTSYDTFQ